MAIRVELRLFSGLRDPAWMLDDDRVTQLTAQFKDLLAAQMVPAFVAPLARPSSGYRGFVVQGRGNLEDQRFRVFGGRVSNTQAEFVDNDRRIEAWLFRSAPDRVRDALQLSFDQLVEPAPPDKVIAGFEDVGAAVHGPCTGAPPFPFPPGDWATYQAENNCYNYANNVVFTRGCAMPGQLSSWSDAAEMRRAATADRLVFCGKALPSACDGPPGAHLMAICLRARVGDFQDFHCLRLDASGQWSHKDGKDPVSDTDGDGQPIVDLRRARFGQAMQLVGLFWSPLNRRIWPA